MANTELGLREAHYFFDDKEWTRFNEIVTDLAATTSGVVGVLAVGSLMQESSIPPSHYEYHDNPLGKAYELVRRPERRKPHHSLTSDLDIWICTKDSSDQGLEAVVNQGGIDLLDRIVADPLFHGSEDWVAQKRARFNPYYKQEELYSRE